MDRFALDITHILYKTDVRAISLRYHLKECWCYVNHPTEQLFYL
jgi:hypothetical protein